MNFDLELMMMSFEQFVRLIDPILSHDASEMNSFVLRWIFDSLFEQNANGNVEKDEFESLLILLCGRNENKKYFNDENLRQFSSSRSNYISFQGKSLLSIWTEENRRNIRLEFSTFVKHGYLRELLMIN